MIADAYRRVWRATPTSSVRWLKVGRTPQGLVAAPDRFAVDVGVLCLLGRKPDKRDTARVFWDYRTDRSGV